MYLKSRIYLYYNMYTRTVAGQVEGGVTLRVQVLNDQILFHNDQILFQVVTYKTAIRNLIT